MPYINIFLIDFTLYLPHWHIIMYDANTGDHLERPPVICNIRMVSFPCQKSKPLLRLILSLHCFRGQQGKGMVIIEKISKTLNIWQVIYHYP